MLARTAMTVAVILVAAGTGWGQWSATEEAKLTASDAAAGDEFGSSVSISGDTALVGAAYDDNGGGTDAGSAHVFVRSGTSWIEQAKLTASDGAMNELFGWSASLSGDTALVGAWDNHAVAVGAGSAYVFVRGGTNWTEQAKLIAHDAEYTDLFGYSVSLSADTAVVGAVQDDHMGGTNAGSAYVFVRNGTSWIEQAKLIAGGAESFDRFGTSVSVSGDTAVVGAPSDDNNAGGADAGSAYVFVRSGTSWTEQAKLVAGDAESSDRFGTSVSVSGDTAVVGAPYHNHAGVQWAGSAYVFMRSGTAWTQQAKLTASDGAFGDLFGWSVSLSGDTAVVGAFEDNLAVGPDAGSAYVFVRSGTGWTEQAKLIAGEGASGDFFGNSVSLSGDTALVGAYEATLAVGAEAGSAYVFRLYPPPLTYCTAGTSVSGCQASISASGTASATAPSGFVLLASAVEGAKDGAFSFGTNGKQATPWGNGTSFQCVVPPLTRTGLLSGPGTIGLCDGTLALDLNALWCPTCPKPAKNPGPGATVQAQLWYRDPLSTSNQTTSLSDAIEFVVAP